MMDAFYPTPPRITFSRSGARCLGLAAALLCMAAPVAAAPHQARTSSDAWVLLEDGAGFKAEAASGATQVLPLAPTAEVSDFAGTDDAWLAAAVEPQADGPAVVVVIRGDAKSAYPLPPLPTSAAPTKLLPMLLTDEVELKAVAWLEGDDDQRLAVRAASWDGAWGEIETVSPQGDGAQLALSAAVLGGTPLLAWSRFDGQDDEIVWSRRTAEGWSTPARLADDNAVPDITPALLTTADGVLAVWSRYDGNDYRLTLSRFDGERWSPATMIGPKGSLFPTFQALAGTSVVVYETAWPRTWSLLTLDARGTLLQQASFPKTTEARPLITAVTPEKVVVRRAGDAARTETLAWSKVGATPTE